jgi:hypothetical protein
MPRRPLLASLVVLALAVAPSCGGGGGDQTAKFVGAWTFTSGSLTPVCLVPGVPPFDLTGLNVTFTKIDDSTISLMINAFCDVHFHVSGNSATAVANQTCSLDLGGALMMQTVNVTKWTLSLSGDHIDNVIAGSVAICTASGTAVLARGTSDAGIGTPRDGSTRDGTSERGSAEAGGGDGGAPEAGPEVGTDAGAESGAEAAGPDAPASEGGSETETSDATSADGDSTG